MNYRIQSVILIVSLWGWPLISQAQSLFQDVKANKVGDVITIILSENITGASKAGNDAESRNSSSVSGSFENDFLSLDDFHADAESEDELSNNATSSQEQLLTGTMSVHIEEITKNGDLFVKGERMTEINGEIHQITLSGYVRPSDVDKENRVPSYRVADASIVFKQKGGIDAEKERRGFVRIALGVASVVTGLSSLILLGL